MKNFDSIIDDVRLNAKAAASAVTQKATMLYDASKHKISAETIRRSIGKKLIELGKLTYKATVQDVDLSEDIAALVEEITGLKQNLDIVNAHIASIRNQKICPECENKVPKLSSFCNICGHKFENDTEPDAAAEEAVEEAAEAVAEKAEESAKAAGEIVEAAKEAVDEITEDAADAVKAAGDAIGSAE